MLSKPFSEEDAQGYLDEFTSWPHKFSPIQLVYAGFRSAASTSTPDNVICYGCQLELDDWSDDDTPLYAHLEDSPDCPIALEIQQYQEDTEEEIKEHTLALITKQKEVRQQNAKNALAEISQQMTVPSIEKEARLLQFYRGKDGMPVDAPLQQTSTESTILTETYDAGLMAAIAEALGEGGNMDGWFVTYLLLILYPRHHFGEWFPANGVKLMKESRRVVNAISEVETEGFGYKERTKVNVLVVKGKINEAQDEAATDGSFPIPGSSLTEGQASLRFKRRRGSNVSEGSSVTVTEGQASPRVKRHRGSSAAIVRELVQPDTLSIQLHLGRTSIRCMRLLPSSSADRSTSRG
ncbi:MAG: hypothetical protein Q9213_005950 [Squamulea squamosa]